MNIYSLSITALFLSALVSFLTTPLVIKFAKKYNLIDDPKKNKHPKVIHTYPVPRAGGIAVLAGILITSIIFLPADKHLAGILMGAVIIIATGVIDDKIDLNPYLRIFIGFAAASFPIFAGVGIAFITNPFGGIIDLSHPQVIFSFLGETRTIWLISDLLALFWIVLLMNMLNMGAKGVDGQLPGVAAIASLAIAFLSLQYSADIAQWPVIILALITAGAFLGFLPWNMFPQKIMPGYSGSTLAGYMLAVMSILTTSKIGILSIVLAVPLIDTTYTIVRRIASGKSPVWGDTGHLHHRLLKLGWSKRSVAIFYWTASLTLGLIGLNLNSVSKFYTIIILSVSLGVFIIWLAKNQKA